MKQAVFLDRDGVINRAIVIDGKPYAPTTLEEFELLPGAEQTIQSLRAAGFVVIVVTNQPDVATGRLRQEVIHDMHAKLRVAGLCHDIKVCYHVDQDRCLCRKPKPGMLFEAADEWGIDLSRSFMVGDRWRDVSAGQAAGCYSFFVDYGYSERRPERPDSIVTSLQEAGAQILHSLRE